MNRIQVHRLTLSGESPHFLVINLQDDRNPVSLDERAGGPSEAVRISAPVPGLKRIPLAGPGPITARVQPNRGSTGNSEIRGF